MKREMDRDQKEGYDGYQFRYRTVIQGVDNKRDCGTLADLVSNQFPTLGTDFSITADHEDKYGCVIAVERHHPRIHVWGYKQKLMNDIDNMRVSIIGKFNTSLFIPDESKCRDLASKLSKMSSRPDCTASVERGMCNISCILRPKWDL